MNLFQTFLDAIFDGNQAHAARVLGVSRSMVSRIARGERGISPALAKRIEEASEGLFRKEQFIWIEAQPAKPQPTTDGTPHVPDR